MIRIALVTLTLMGLMGWVIADDKPGTPKKPADTKKQGDPTKTSDLKKPAEPSKTGEPKKPVLPDLTGYRTVDQAVQGKIVKAASTIPVAGHLGLATSVDPKGRLVVEDVEMDSPAALAGIKSGDVVISLDGKKVPTVDALRTAIQMKAPKTVVKLGLSRGEKPVEVSATLTAVSRPLSPNPQRLSLGFRLSEVQGGGAPIRFLDADSPAAKAGLKTGDFVTKIDGQAIVDGLSLSDLFADKKAGDQVVVTISKDGKAKDVKVALVGEAGRGGFGGFAGNWDTRAGNYWKKDVYRLAIIGIEYPDEKHNPKIATKDWEESMFSKEKYVKKTSVTGQPVYGSLNDYYHELSCGTFRVEGKMFDWVEVGKKRADYASATGPTRTALLSEAMDKVLKRDGKDALKNFDGVFFLYAGDRYPTNRGGLYWPHRANFSHDGTRWSYFICAEGGSRMGNISVFCHEFGHMLGLPDLYARPENPGSEGVGVWCAMSNQVGNGRPQHFSAWCKEMLGWVKPTVIDPTVKQRLILAPIENSTKECFKVLVRPDGSEYLLLENRKRRGFDESLPAEGLLIWRVVGNRPILEESHGVEGAAGPRSFPTSVPFPSPSNTAFTPFTTPSSRSQLGGGLPVFITNIRRLPDGRITFHVGYEYQ